MSVIFKKIFSTMIAFVMLAIFSPSAFNKGYQPKNPDELVANFAVISDCHIEGNNFTTYKNFAKILKDIKSSSPDNDALVFLGDNTMNGQTIESNFFYGTVNAINPAKQYINLVGNHDVGNGQGDYETLLNRYIDYTKTIMGDDFNSIYYHKVINGVYMVVLATESQTVNAMDISDEQLEWLSGVIAQAKAENAPVLVFNHYPSFYLLDRNMYDLTDVLNDYDNLVYFGGHTHIEFGQGSVYTFNGVNCINLPRTTEGVDYDCGVGAQVEVYEDEILVRMRDYESGKWLEEYEYSYSIK